MADIAEKGHPKGLYTLFFTEMWERFSYYGMRALLVLYLTSQLLNGGFGFEEITALELYGIFTGLVYLTPIVGGLLADKILGQRKAIFIGGILMALGQFVLAYSSMADDIEFRKTVLYSGLGLLIIGNGFFKPNISTIVGGLYSLDDPRKDSAFTIFYMGINLGAFLSPLICGTLGEQVGWEYGFASAGLGMVLGLIFFYFRGPTLNDIGFPPKRTGDERRYIAKDWMDIFLYVVVCTLLVIGFIKIWFGFSESLQNGIIITLAVVGGIGLFYTIASNTKGKDQWSRVGVILVLALFNIFFWSGFEQAGGTFNIFARDNTQRVLFGWEIPAAWFQSINAIAIFALAPIFSTLWMRLTQIGKNPRTTVKFAMGLGLLSLGFVVMSAANSAASDGSLVSPLWLIGVYLLHTIGELCLSPIGLSMITKLSPPPIVSVMMGLWFASMALANYVAGALKGILVRWDMELFNFLTLTSLIAGVILLLISPLLNKMMKGIH